MKRSEEPSGPGRADSRAKLVLVEGELAERVFELGDGGLSLGRTGETDVRLPAARVSRRHCAVERRGDSWWLCDLGSRNGTFLNGTAIREHRLEDGDRLRIADWTFLFHQSGEEEAEAEDREPHHPALTTQELSVEEGLYFDPARLVETRDGSERLAGVLRAARLASTERSLPELASSISSLLLDTLPAERAVVRFELPGMAPLERQRWRDDSEPPPLSATVCRGVLEDRVAIMTNRVTEEPALQGAASLQAGEVESVLAVPLLAEPSRSLGLLYVDSRSGPQTFERWHLLWLTAVAGLVAAALPRLRHQQWLESEAWGEAGPGLVGESRGMRSVLETVARVATTDATLLIQGESGTGKELVARALHIGSRRRHGPFVAVNCASLSDSLLESELLGHERGAFTGAVRRKLGKLEIADGGTLFLDEVGELGLALQARLLRFLETLEFERVGGTETLRTDLRLVAATNRDLETAMAEGRFREDLFYRLNVVPLRLPPLRERREDIPLLAHHFLALHGQRLRRPGVALSRAALERMQTYDWPGNVRQLSNVIERAVILAAGDWIEPEDLPAELLGQPPPETGYQAALDRTKRQLITDAVQAADGNITEAARALRLSPNYLHRLIKNLDLRDEIGRRGSG